MIFKHNFSSLRNLFSLLLVITFLFVCFFPVFYLVIFRWIDYFVCYTCVSIRLNHTFISADEIINYIQGILKPGMTQYQVEKELEKIGHINVLHGEILEDGQRFDTIWIKMCLHTFNNFRIVIIYSKEDRFIDLDYNSDW